MSPPVNLVPQSRMSSSRKHLLESSVMIIALAVMSTQIATSNAQGAPTTAPVYVTTNGTSNYTSPYSDGPCVNNQPCQNDGRCYTPPWNPAAKRCSCRYRYFGKLCETVKCTVYTDPHYTSFDGNIETTFIDWIKASKFNGQLNF